MRLLFFLLLLTYQTQTYVYKTVGTDQLKLDVFTPEDATKNHPAIILFHGGSWISGDRSQLAQQCQYFVQQGMVAITADYRLLKKETAAKNGADKDSLIVDAISAVQWIKTHAAQLHIDTTRLILGGASAGGHLATMALLNAAINGPADNKSIAVTARALVLFNPAYNPTEAAAVQPYTFPAAQIPPTIFFYGSNDKWKPAGDSLRVQLKKAGVNSEMWVAEGQVHGFFNKAPWTEATCIKAQTFLTRLGILEAKNLSPAPSPLRREDN